MAARRMKGAWWVDFRFRGERIRKKSPVDTKRGAEEFERQERQRLLDGKGEEQEVPTFAEWFWGPDASSLEPAGRFWLEWVISRKNKPGEMEQKRSIYRTHLGPYFGKLPIDQIGTAEIARFRASLIARDRTHGGNPAKKTPPRRLEPKTINNILAVLSKPLRYAVDAQVIERAPKVGLFKLERPEFECWDLEEYARLLAAARDEGLGWYAAACLAGEDGLRVGEIKALRWREDVDLLAGTLTVNRQVRHGQVGTPKGRTRRVVPMTATSLDALIALGKARTGLVLRNEDGSPVSDSQARDAMYRICRRAGLPERGWHVLRHSFGTHAALFGVNPWTLMRWMGHKRIDETMLYVNIATAHARPLPVEIIAAGSGAADPDARVLRMLAARVRLQDPGHLMGTGVRREGEAAGVAGS